MVKCGFDGVPLQVLWVWEAGLDLLVVVLHRVGVDVNTEGNNLGVNGPILGQDQSKKRRLSMRMVSDSNIA